MGKEFSRFTTNPEVSRCAAQAHALRNRAMADAVLAVGHALAGLVRGRRTRPTGLRPA